MAYSHETQHPPDYTVTWHRQPGMFSDEVDGHIMTGVSANRWYDFYDMISNLPGGLSPRQIISPELMTASDIPLADLAKRSAQHAVRRRLDKVETLSRRLPRLEFAIGTPEYTEGAVYNSVLGLKGGERSVLARKSFLTPGEEGVFDLPSERSAHQERVRHLICAELIGHIEPIAPIEPTASSLRASCCWAVLLADHEVPGYTLPPDEERYLGAMHATIQQLMAQQAVGHLFIVDRTPPGGTTQPYNCIVRRN